RVAVLGAMLELGDASHMEHRRMTTLARALGIDVVAVGTGEYGTDPLPDVDAALRALTPLVSGDAVLVKASRAAGLERLAERLIRGEADARPAGGDARAARADGRSAVRAGESGLDW